jgi:CubicO group peptidase (beta-lactamase class C family)
MHMEEKIIRKLNIVLSADVKGFHLKHQFVTISIFSLLLLFCNFDSNSMASGLADVPLTKATPESQNLSKTILDAAIIKIEKGDYGKIHSLLIIRNHYLILENYFSGYERDDIHPVYSVTKSVTSALVGIAIKQGKINSVNTKILEFFPEYENIANLDSGKRKISLENVLTMTAGFQWDELSTSYFNPLNDARKMAASKDSVKYVLDLPMRNHPERVVYNSGCSMLLSGVLNNTTGQSAEEFAIDHLFNPLGIKEWHWSIVKNGTINTAWGLRLRPIDMARFGILFSNDGLWLNNKIIPKAWRKVSTQKHAQFGRYGYGYQWWRFLDHNSIVSNLAINDVYFAWGFGGQHIFVIPHLNMVVVSTGENFTKRRLFFDLLRDHIFPAVLD